MTRTRAASRLLTLVSLLLLSACGPPLVWGSDTVVRQRLLAIVPPGSAPAALDAAARSRGWRERTRDDRRFRRELSHYFGGGCRYAGGISVYVVVAEYGVLTTSVETVWMFDAAERLADVGIRRTTDGP